jgi:membrane fusion protein, copper/silver efflux system
MKKIRLVTIILSVALSVVVGGAILVSSGCQKGGEPTVAAKRWHCPMHPEVIKDGPGDCPICGMKLVPIEEEAHEAAVAGTKAHSGERKILFYRSPMNPQETSPTPKKDEMGMDFVAVYSDEVEEEAKGPEGLASVTIDAQKQQLLGLTTVAVKRAPFETSIRTTGRVAYDERRVHHVHTRYEAYVEHIEADFTGKYVRKGEVLAMVYSPELYATQQEYLLALKASRSLGGSRISSVAEGGQDLLAAARQRLLLWDVSPGDIEALGERGEPTRTLNIYAPASGFVTARTAYHGMKVMPADSLFDIADLSSVWVLADVYEYELPRLRLGQKGEMTLSYWPGRSWTGRVSFIYPAVDEKTRTVKVRLDFANPKEELRPEMFAQVTIQGSPRDALVVPDDVVLDSGTRKVVFVAEGEGKLSPREIVVGDHAGGVYEVTAGLTEGQTVARGANFLVDSESRLKAALSAMTATATKSSVPATPADRKP